MKDSTFQTNTGSNVGHLMSTNTFTKRRNKGIEMVGVGMRVEELFNTRECILQSCAWNISFSFPDLFRYYYFLLKNLKCESENLTIVFLFFFFFVLLIIRFNYLVYGFYIQTFITCPFSQTNQGNFEAYNSVSAISLLKVFDDLRIYIYMTKSLF